MSSSDLAPALGGAPSPADGRRLVRARALVEQMTVPERIAMLHQYSPGVERLGIGPFVTGTEGVHGLAWKGLATQFPQPVGMAASWDPELLAAAATITPREVRELHAADPTVSLSVWAPVVNTLRHPLWGRTEEAYTEDPLLNAALAGGFSRGLRGDGENWQVLPTLKHFLAYSNETDRCATSSELSLRVLHEYELPGFVEPVASGLAASVMLSYNLVNGRPAHLTDLLESQLRSRLPDPDLLFVVTDAGAPSNLFRAEKVVPDAASAYAAMLRAGADSFTDQDSDPRESIDAVTEALERGLIDVSHVDRAVVRQLVARARTGELDDQPAASGGPLPSDPEHPERAQRRALSREVAVRSAVLLARADESALPLRPGALAVLGEQALAVLGDWYSGDAHSDEHRRRPARHRRGPLDPAHLPTAGRGGPGPGGRRRPLRRARRGPLPRARAAGRGRLAAPAPTRRGRAALRPAGRRGLRGARPRRGRGGPARDQHVAAGRTR